MKFTITEATLVPHTHVHKMMAEHYPDMCYTLDALEFKDMSRRAKGRLYSQNDSFFIFDVIPARSSRRVGPAKIAPTRHWFELHITLMTKHPEHVKNAKLLETVAGWFEESTVDGVRFRTFTTYPIGKDSGFTFYQGVIPFDFELYRGG